jgi:hypothetical protein
MVSAETSGATHQHSRPELFLGNVIFESPSQMNGEEGA